MTSTGTGAATATDDNCNFSPSQTVTQGVSTLVYTMSFDAGGYVSILDPNFDLGAIIDLRAATAWAPYPTAQP